MIARPSPSRIRAEHWGLDPSVTFLNHGSFGACPIPVLEAQREYRRRMESEPVRFFVRELEALLDGAREDLARFLGADPCDLAFVPNATTGVNAVLRSLRFDPGDELLVTDHAYNACANALRFVADLWGAAVVVAPLPFPIRSFDEVLESVLGRVSPKTRLALVDHVTSPTGLVLDIARIVAALDARGVPALVDGAHAPGMIRLDLKGIGAHYYAGNCHKWICAPKGAGFLHVRSDVQKGIRPVVISHGANSPRTDRSRFLQEFDWTGTDDPTAFLCVPHALRFMGSLLPGGWDALEDSNRRLALGARGAICGALGIPHPSPDGMVGSLAAFPIPDGSPEPPPSALYNDPLQDDLLETWGIEAPLVPWPAPPKRLIRISAQIYNTAEEYDYLAGALASVFGL